MRLLVHGAAGGVGTAAVQLGRLLGAHVTATVRAEGSREAVAALGADVVLDPADVIEHGPFDVLLELVGAPNLPGDVQALTVGGHIVVIGVGAGPDAELDLLALMGKRGTVCASTLRARPLEEKALTARRVEEQVLPAVPAGAPFLPGGAHVPARRGRRGIRLLRCRREGGEGRAAALIRSTRRASCRGVHAARDQTRRRMTGRRLWATYMRAVPASLATRCSAGRTSTRTSTCRSNQLLPGLLDVQPVAVQGPGTGDAQGQWWGEAPGAQAVRVGSREVQRELHHHRRCRGVPGVAPPVQVGAGPVAVGGRCVGADGPGPVL